MDHRCRPLAYAEIVAIFEDPTVSLALKRYIAVLRSNPRLRIVAASQHLMDEGLGVFEQHADKAWSLTDCISFSIMRGHSVHEALTTDRHFERVGFRALLRADPP